MTAAEKLENWKLLKISLSHVTPMPTWKEQPSRQDLVKIAFECLTVWQNVWIWFWGPDPGFGNHQSQKHRVKHKPPILVISTSDAHWMHIRCTLRFLSITMLSSIAWSMMEHGSLEPFQSCQTIETYWNLKHIETLRSVRSVQPQMFRCCHLPSFGKASRWVWWVQSCMVSHFLRKAPKRIAHSWEQQLKQRTVEGSTGRRIDGSTFTKMAHPNNTKVLDSQVSAGQS
jgi:hypothetical protein